MQFKKPIKILLAVVAFVCLYELSFTYFARQHEQEAVESTDNEAQALDWLKESADEEIWLGYTYMECKKREFNLGLDLRGGVSLTLEIAVDKMVESLAGTTVKNSPEFKVVSRRAKELKSQQAGNYIDLFGQAYQESMNGQSMARWFAGKGDLTINSTDDEVLEMLNTSAEGAIGQAKEVIRTRVSQFGIAQPDIKLVGNTGRIIVDLPGVKDHKRVEKLLQGSAELEIWDTYYASDLSAAFVAWEEKARDYLNLTEPFDSTSFENLTREDSLAKVALRNQPLTNLVVKDDEILKGSSRAGLGIYKISDTAYVNKLIKVGYAKKVFPKQLQLAWSSESDLGERSGAVQLYALKKESNGKAYLSGEFIKSAKRDFRDAKDVVLLDFKTNKAGKWEQITQKSFQATPKGKPIAIVLDGLVYAAPGAHNGAIPNGRTEITFGSSGNGFEVATDLANVLNAGKFPAPAKIVQMDFVGPSLGADSIDAAVLSFILALGLVLIYMVFYYNTAGWAANVALVANIIIIIGVIASNPDISLTLSGVAGIVLTVGMSVDANVLIYERIREELRLGKSMKLAIADGYKHAYTAILDANITTLITGIILWYFGTSVIESFAQTLVIGIFSSLFSAIFITRLIFEWLLVKEKKIKFSTPTTEKWFSKAQYNIISSRKKFYVASGLLIIIGLVSIFSRGFNQGIDFAGGRSYKVGFEQAPSPEDVKKSLSNYFIENGASVGAEVKAVTGKEHLLITTKYLINDDSELATTQVEEALYAGLKDYLPATLNKVDFVRSVESTELGILQKNVVESTIADDIIDAAYTSVIYALIAIFLYVAVRFRQWQFGLGALIAIFHDVVIVLGLFSLLQGIMPFPLEINTAFVAAILTVVGYSINDTVVVFDRVRERTTGKSSEGINVVVNKALNSTLSRTFNTSMTIIVVLLAILIFGGALRSFAFALLIGVIVGTYSSICIASPIYTDLVRRNEK